FQLDLGLSQIGKQPRRVLDSLVLLAKMLSEFRREIDMHRFLTQERVQGESIDPGELANLLKACTPLSLFDGNERRSRDVHLVGGFRLLELGVLTRLTEA